MRLAMIGLGRMGGNMTERLLRGGHAVVAYDRDRKTRDRAASAGGTAVDSLDAMLAAMPAPRIIWMMVPAGAPVDETIEALHPRLTEGDILIDGGNSNFHDTIRRARALESRGLELIDCGTSGGIWGLENGYCLMIGGSKRAVTMCEPIFKSLAPPHGYAHVGSHGAGHYVKMIHNGVEYGMMQAYAEGYEILHAAPHFKLDVHQIAELWNHGSVVRSWLNELAARALARDPDLAGLDDWVADSGEGRWTVQEAIDRDVPAPVITLALLARLRSRQDTSYGAKILAALRAEFGGHAVRVASDQ